MDRSKYGSLLSVHNMLTFMLLFTGFCVVIIFVLGTINPEELSITFVRFTTLTLLSVCILTNIIILFSQITLDALNDDGINAEIRFVLITISFVTLMLSTQYGIDFETFELINSIYGLFIGISLVALNLGILLTIYTIIKGSNKSTTIEPREDTKLNIESTDISPETQDIINKNINYRYILQSIDEIPDDKSKLMTKKETYTLIGEDTVNYLITQEYDKRIGNRSTIDRAIKEIKSNKTFVGKLIYEEISEVYEIDVGNQENIKILSKRIVYLGESKEIIGEDIDMYMKIISQFLETDMSRRDNITPSKVKEHLEEEVGAGDRIKLEEFLCVEENQIRDEYDTEKNDTLSENMSLLQETRIFEDAYIGEIDRTQLPRF